MDETETLGRGGRMETEIQIGLIVSSGHYSHLLSIPSPAFPQMHSTNKQLPNSQDSHLHPLPPPLPAHTQTRFQIMNNYCLLNT